MLSNDVCILKTMHKRGEVDLDTDFVLYVGCVHACVYMLYVFSVDMLVYVRVC